MTQRDWQKDMEMCQEEQLKEDSNIQSRMMGALGSHVASHWLQEAKEQKERANGMFELLQRIKKNADEFRALTGVEEHVNIADQAETFNTILIAEKARADAVEAREQQLKEAVEEFLPDMMPVTRALMKRTLSTLYPDTPAPKEGE